MTEEIKEILDRFNKGHDELTVEEYILLENCITNLQQNLDKANDIIDKGRQFYKCRMDEYVELKKENKTLKAKLEIGKTCGFCPYYDYKSRCEGTINLIDRTIEIIKQQPTKDDNWILSRLYGFKYALNGSDEE